jgi:cyd operon protein YbgT
MWYFTWILGLGAALAFGIINVMWLESSFSLGELDEEKTKLRFGDRSPPVNEQSPADAQTATPSAGSAQANRR